VADVGLRLVACGAREERSGLERIAESRKQSSKKIQLFRGFYYYTELARPLDYWVKPIFCLS